AAARGQPDEVGAHWRRPADARDLLFRNRLKLHRQRVTCARPADAVAIDARVCEAVRERVVANHVIERGLGCPVDLARSIDGVATAASMRADDERSVPLLRNSNYES